MSGKRKQILEVAMQLFAQRGLLNVSTGQIAMAANLSPALLLQEFDGKEDLLVEILRDLKLASNSAAHKDLRLDMGLREHLNIMWHHAITWALSNPQHYQLLLELSISEEALTLLGLTHDDFSHLFPKHALMEAMGHGEIATLPMTFHQQLFRTQLDGTVQFILRTKPDPKQSKVYIEQSFAIYWRGIHNG
ncbi:TetR/AcrR family transcriptional regulator [Magnetococcus sp. PR-3]|uniref:TetR/AcrR family transcriptional regulator n=1 Tax=Magnetococcus sp. PR-3 TaxID=3120355 RepID=UPI002FCE4832